uniref:Uncharacterized protein n=1 Tax=Psilocybe cubensis TaxID=181762 RepID=A0A8H8CJB9_PSICU
MSLAEFPLGQSRVVAGRYPPPGSDPHADAIRERRGPRGITPLDANLLHVPPIAGGFNSLLGAVRTKGNLPGDLREIMILRVAALNHASFEWIHHEIVARKEGLSTGQLYVIRDVDTPLPPISTVLTSLHTSALVFTDHSTRTARVPMDVIHDFKKELKSWLLGKDTSCSEEQVNAKVEDLYVEAAMVVASYNMVSRFLLSTDVAGLADMEVPWPVEKKEHFVTLPSFPPAKSPTHTIHAVTLVTDPSAPWLVFANSLLTDWTMWSYVVPYFLDFPSDADNKKTYNILLHSQRGHGKSTLPDTSPSDLEDKRLTTIPFLAHDIANLIDMLHIPLPVKSVIGVSQGGAAALAFGTLYGGGSNIKTESIVACDTSPRTAAGNKEAWDERIRLAFGPESSNATEYAERIGMRKLASVTVPRWFPPGSLCNPTTSPLAHGIKRAEWVERMIQATQPAGFAEGARALSEYDLLDDLFKNPVGKALLVSGSLDGGGKVGQGLQSLCETWKPHLESVKYLEIGVSGHLPMIDAPEVFTETLSQWIQGI